ncbi:aspartate/glutamate racemase family protein [Paenibacillus sp.]|uniref:aspartate/glutamate racemase family protein n=1 Tax=Paenibacillus sp. TaxID=58172 RepID=UPI002D359748|nr:aspartate/glutamate racemase family protein [Paenibacillus sp.]HZG87086.1 aspartate/glutamate racemase family protein [Paenibacillus sp.]
MNRTLAIIHTTVVTVEPLKELALSMIPNCEIINFVDDSILPELAGNGGDPEAVKERLCAYATFAERRGADCILSACSSVGEIASAMQARVDVPVVRIDEAMAEAAVRAGGRIGVAATLDTTLRPTLALLRRKADEAGNDVEFRPLLVDEAYRRLIAGDKEGHDAALAEALERLIGGADTVVLAQASMARVLPRLPEGVRDRFLASPRLGMQRVKETLERAAPNAGGRGERR